MSVSAFGGWSFALGVQHVVYGGERGRGFSYTLSGARARPAPDAPGLVVSAKREIRTPFGDHKSESIRRKHASPMLPRVKLEVCSRPDAGLFAPPRDHDVSLRCRRLRGPRCYPHEAAPANDRADLSRRSESRAQQLWQRFCPLRVRLPQLPLRG
eukprot:769287-Prymnesium_polylepis.1